MNRMEFIQTIMELYPNTFHPDNEKQFRGWVNRYKEALPESWDFNKLLKIFDREWNSTVIPPHPSFFRAFKEDVKPSKQNEVIKAHEITKEEQEKILARFSELKKQMKSLAKSF